MIGRRIWISQGEQSCNGAGKLLAVWVYQPEVVHPSSSLWSERSFHFGEPQQIIITFMSAEVPFGDAAPDVVQFFESFRVENGACVWEVF